MSLLRALSIIMISFYCVMFYSWQSFLPDEKSSHHTAWAQDIADAQNEDTLNETEEIIKSEEEIAKEEDEAAEALALALRREEETSKGESTGIMQTIGSLFLLKKEEKKEELTPLDYYIEGLEYYQNERYNLAFLNFRDAITGEEKEERAYFWLGQIYHLGHGGPVNLNKAADFYLLAYESGDPRIHNLEILQDLYDKNGRGAGYILGRLYYDGHLPRDDRQALKYLQTDADKGHVEANYYIGLIHYEGVQVEKSYLLAVEYLEKASIKNYHEAHILLGRIYYRGEGYIGKDPQRARRFFNNSASQGNRKGQYYLAGMYYVGDVVEQDYQQAKALFEKSAAQNYPPSQYFLGQLYYHGHGVKRDYQKALDWYKKAAEQRHVPAILRVAQFHQLGYGVAESEIEALKYYKKAALLDSADARFQLAMMYYGVDGDLKKVIALLHEAAMNGHKMAQYNLGQFYRHGIGVKHDNLLAWVWFSIALNHGNDMAKQDVEVMQARLSPQQIQQGENYLDRWLLDHKRTKSVTYHQ